MQQTTQRIRYLLQRIHSREASPAECEELAALADSDKSEEVLQEANAFYQNQPSFNKEVRAYDRANWQPVLNDILNLDKPVTGAVDAGNKVSITQSSRSAQGTTIETRVLQPVRMNWFRYAAAAIIFIGTFAAIVLYSNRQSLQQTTARDNKRVQTDIAPGTNRAILTVDNKTIDLAANKTGIAINNTITYTDGEKILPASETRLLQLATPKGGQYQAVLPDGTRVWLNAASSIKFPSRFDGVERKVEITGEAYLEVVKNAKQPFIVQANATVVRVLGTSFNINAYPDEPYTKATLLEGSIKIDNSILKPGQAYTAGKVITTNTDQDLAWKNGAFNFEGATVENFMRQLARWYDVKVVYKDKIHKGIFHGDLGRDLRLGQILEVLSEFNIHYKLEGRTLTIE